MKNQTLHITRRWIVPVVVLGVIAFSWLAVRDASAGGDRDEHKRIVIESSGEHKAFLGVLMQELTDEILEGLDTKVKRGVLITEVIDGSPADKAGIQDGDIIVEFGGKKVDSPDELRDLVAEQEIGDEIKVKVVRDDASETVEITLGDWADQSGFSWTGDFAPQMDRAMRFVGQFSHKQLGVRVSQVNEDLGSYFGVDEGEGVLVLSVIDESTAEAIGVKAGDVVVEVEGEEIQSAGDIRESLSDIDDGDEVNVLVVRKKKRVELKGEYEGNSHATWLHGWQDHGQRVRAFTIPDDYKDELRKELDELREELEELKKELKKS